MAACMSLQVVQAVVFRRFLWMHLHCVCVSLGGLLRADDRLQVWFATLYDLQDFVLLASCVHHVSACDMLAAPVSTRPLMGNNNCRMMMNSMRMTLPFK